MQTDFRIYNAVEFFIRECSDFFIPSLSQSLDNVLGLNGIQQCDITEILGLPGTGKTQICLQLCASVQIRNALGGLDSDALYIDTNTNFTLERFKEILSASLLRSQNLLRGMSLCIDESEEKENEALKKLNYVNAFGLEKFSAFMHRLPRFLAEHPRIKLIVIDSISFPFKEGISEKQRTRLLFRQMAELQRLSVQKQIAVVLTNEMSHRVGVVGSPVVGALGDAWAHRCNRRVLLTSHDAGGRSEKVALLLKSNCIENKSSTVARFQITRGGIRDIE